MGETQRKRTRPMASASAVAAVLLCAAAIASGAEPESAKLATDPASGQGFGGAVASAGDLVVVADGVAEKVHVYERASGGWSGTPAPIATILRPSGIAAGSRFGESVAISADGSLIVVGAPGADVESNPDIGRVYAYKRPVGGWSGNPDPYTKLGHPVANYFHDGVLEDTPPASDNLQQGLRVLAAPDGSWLGFLSWAVVTGGPGAWFFTNGGPGIISLIPVETEFLDRPTRRLERGVRYDGAVPIPPTNWMSLATNDDGTTIFAGDPRQWGGPGEVVAWNDPTGDWDFCCLFSSGGYQPPDAELTTPIIILQPGRTGASLAALGDYVVAGAPHASVGGTSQAGSVFVWKKPPGGWYGLVDQDSLQMGQPVPGIMPIATLTASDPAAMARFGQSIGIFDDAIGVAAPGATVGANASQGKAYLFREPVAGWSGNISNELTQFAASDGAANDDLGSFFSYSHPVSSLTEAGQELTMTSTALVAAAPEQGKPTYVFEFEPPSQGCPATPDPACVVAPRSLLKLQGGKKQSLAWTWLGGATDLANLGDPTATTSYRLCIYDDDELATSSDVPAGGTCGGKPCWKASKSGFAFKDSTGINAGITSIKLKSGSAGKIAVKGKGVSLTLPLPVVQASSVDVQLVSSNGNCFGATLPSPAIKNEPDRFEDKVAP